MRNKIILNFILIQTCFLSFSQEKKVVTATDNIYIEGQCDCYSLSGKKYTANYTYEGKFKYTATIRSKKLIDNHYKISGGSNLTGKITKFEIQGINNTTAGITVPFSANSAINGNKWNFSVIFKNRAAYIKVTSNDNVYQGIEHSLDGVGFYTKTLRDKIVDKLAFNQYGISEVKMEVYVKDLDEQDIDERHTFLTTCKKIKEKKEEEQDKKEEEKLNDENSDNDDDIIDGEDDFLSENYKDSDDFLADENTNANKEGNDDFLSGNTHNSDKKNYKIENRDGLQGVVDNNGKILIPFKKWNIVEYSDGVATIKKIHGSCSNHLTRKTTDLVKTSYVNKYGNVIESSTDLIESSYYGLTIGVKFSSDSEKRKWIEKTRRINAKEQAKYKKCISQLR